MKNENPIDLYIVTFISYTCLVVAGAIYKVDWAMYLTSLLTWWFIMPLIIFGVFFIERVVQSMIEDPVKHSSYKKFIARICLVVSIAALGSQGRYEVVALCLAAILGAVFKYKVKKTLGETL